MTAILCDSVADVHTRPRAIPLAMITKRKQFMGFPFFLYGYEAPLGASGLRSSAINVFVTCLVLIYKWPANFVLHLGKIVEQC